MHIATSMLKILVASMGAQDIETVRRSMGGHGFSEFAALGRYYADWLPVATYVVSAPQDHADSFVEQVRG